MAVQVRARHYFFCLVEKPHDGEKFVVDSLKTLRMSP